MTKSVRIENADTSTYKVRITTQIKSDSGNWVDGPEPVVELGFPTSIATVGVHSHKRLIVEEYV